MMFDLILSSVKSFKSRASARLFCISRSIAHLIAIIICLLIVYQACLEAEMLKSRASNLQVDVSFIIVDLKYHPERGAQICEIQHGGISGFKGHAMWHEGQDLIAQKLLNKLDGFYEKSWAAIDAFADPTIRELLNQDINWFNIIRFSEFDDNTEFQINAALPVGDPTDLSKYHGFVFMCPLTKVDRNRFKNKYPGVVLVDNAFYDYANNKYKMTDLLSGHPLTEKHKPKWGIYHKDGIDLADRINSEIGSDMVVIKPTNEYKGVGVVIVKKEELKSVLNYLFNIKDKSIQTADPAYHYWRNGKAIEFIVEEFIDVEPVSIAHLDSKLYSPTMRLAYLLFYNKQKIEINCLGGYYTLPKTALSDPGSLNEHYKSYVYSPYFSKADPNLMKQANAEITEVLNIIYQKLLKI